MILTNCPTCQQPIDTDRIIQNKAYCSCGQVVNFASAHDGTTDFILVKRLFILVMAGILVTAHMITWGSHSFKIIPLKIKSMLGVASINDLQSIATICDEQKRWTCEIQALSDLFRKSPNDLAYLANLAQVQSEHGQAEAARTNYSNYFRLGGRDETVRLQYANLLASLGDSVDARKQYSYLVTHRQEKPQFEIAREYVHFLMKNHDYPTAKNIIRKYRRSSPTAALFLNSEWVQINDQIHTGRRPASVN